MKQGSSSHFRNRSLEERLMARVGAWMPGGVRRVMGGVYRRALQRRAEHLVCTLPGGERIKVLVEHRHIGWNPEEYATFHREVRAGDVVLDIGANLGAYTLAFGQWVGPSGRVYAFEPAPDARAGLERHVSLNALDDRIVIRPEAVSAAPGTARFLASGASGSNRIAPGDPGGDVVATTSVDAFCAPLGLKPDVIKIDVEGAELDVLKGARATIASAGPGLRLYVEMHPGLWPGLGLARRDIEAELDAQGLRAECLDGAPALWDVEGVSLRLRPCAS